MKVIVDTSALIALFGIDRLDLLRKLFTNADILILDDKKARSIARRLGLKIIGTMGILVLAKKQKLIDDIETEINRLLQTSFYLSRDVITKALEISRKDC